MVLVLILLSFIPSVLSVSDWNLFIFAQEWPPAVCVQAKRDHHKCSIPKEVNSWGIHGLWPTLKGTEGPTGCNNSWPFSMKPIEKLLPDMEKHWPNMFADTSLSSFWEHEWSKHGTCATSLAVTANEYDYFSTALKLSNKYDATKLFNKHGIVPSKTASFNYTEYLAALMQELGGAEPVIQCEYDQDTKKHIIYEVEICLDKQTFKPVSCYSSDNGTGKRAMTAIDFLQKRRRHSGNPQSDCPKTKEIYYPPIPGVEPDLVGRDIDISVL